MFKTISGPITIYSNDVALTDEDIFSLSKRIDIQYDYGAIEKFNADVLIAVIAKDERAVKYAERRQYAKAIAKYNKDVSKNYHNNKLY